LETNCGALWLVKSASITAGIAVYSPLAAGIAVYLRYCGLLTTCSTADNDLWRRHHLTDKLAVAAFHFLAHHKLVPGGVAEGVSRSEGRGRDEKRGTGGGRTSPTRYHVCEEREEREGEGERERGREGEGKARERERERARERERDGESVYESVYHRYASVCE
jgi:hypothetical protein